MKKIDKLLMSVIIFCGVFTSLYLLTPYFRSVSMEPTLADTLGINKPIPSIRPQVPEECLPECEHKKAIETAVTVPGCDVYSIDNNQARRIGNLVDRSFACVILKKFKVGPVKYYLIQVTEPGYKPDKWIVRDGGLIIMEDCSSIF